jgi:hypothetical protein
VIRRFTRHARRESPAMVDAWVVTFTDLLTLLVTLFVLFISMATFRQGYVAGGPNVDWSLGRAPVPPGPAGDVADVPAAERALTGIGEAGARVEQARLDLARAGLEGGYRLTFDARGMVLRFNDPLLAGPVVTRDGHRRLDHLAAYLNRSGRRVEVTAHAGRRGPAGFAVAARRADAVAGALIDGGAAGAQVVPVARTRPYGEPVEAEGEVPDGVVIFVFGD